VFKIPRLSLILLFAVLFGCSTRAHAIQNFDEVTEQDVPIKKTLPLYLQHKLGNVTIQGWVQDRIRVTIKKHVLADSETNAKKEFAKLSLITLQTEDSFELRLGHTQGTDLVTKMKDVTQSQVGVDLEIKAPYQSDLTVVLGEGRALNLQEWRGRVTITGKDNTLELSKLSLSQPIYVNCVECQTNVRDAKMEGHLLVGSKPILLSDVDGKRGLSIDAGNEEIKIENAKGNITVHSKGGRMTANKFDGSLHFQSVDGGAFINDFSGDVSVQTQTGQVMLDVAQNSSTIDIDTEKSDIQISLLPSFIGGLDLMSLRGEIVVQFPYETRKSNVEEYGPASPGRIDGFVGGDQKIRVHAYTKQGGVRVLRKAPGR
jgi:hypothetical protein